MKRLAIILWTLFGFVGMLTCVSFVITTAYGRITFGSVTPPAHMRTIADFMTWHPHPTYAARVSVRGSTYYIIYGDYGRSGASYYSAYTFDDKGNFVDWTIDAGDIFTPAIVYSDDATREAIPLSELPK